jgi:hypothetical protein
VAVAAAAAVLDVDRVADGSRGAVAHGNRKDGDKSAAPDAGRLMMRTAATAAGGISIIPCKTSRIIATMAHLIATNPVVVV